MPGEHFRYFTVLKGLRGCYMPDSVNEMRFTSRKALKEFLTEEAAMIDGAVGLSKKDIAWAAAHAWMKNGVNSTILPYGVGKDKAKSWSIEICGSTFKDWRAAMESEQ